MTATHARSTVFVGLSGGVDSSVAALTLIEEGYDVVGVFIKTWHPDFLPCTEADDRLDAMRVAAYLKIPFLTLDARDVYKKEVADYMIREYAAGGTPNPDVLCNRHVKFGAFLNFARKHGADSIATGHYARKADRGGSSVLLRGADRNKDQSYFLWTLTQEQLAHTLFPIGHLDKHEVRLAAEKAGLPTAYKPDSQGICFLGDVEIRAFLSPYVASERGDVLNENGEVIGTHEGALFFTSGQRHGFTLQRSDVSGIPHFVIGKDMARNTLTVSPQPTRLHNATIMLHDVHLIHGAVPQKGLTAQFRYRQSPFAISAAVIGETISVTPHADVDAPSEGQSAVLYCGDTCIGGGIIR